MGESPFQCSIHGERMTTLDKRIDAIEKINETKKEEQDELKKFVYKAMGGLAVIALLFSCVVGPLVLDYIKGPKADSMPTKYELVVPGQSTNRYYLK